MKKEKKYKIILTGGGTGGSVTPLLAVYDQFKEENGRFENTEFIWIGTKKGIEKRMVSKEKIRYIAILSGKYRRYFSLKNFFDLFLISLAIFQSIFIILKEKPNLVMSAGGFVSVPFVWAAWLLRVPVMIHQQDIRPGLANKLMAAAAKKITVTFDSSVKDYGDRAKLVGNPVRLQFKTDIPDRKESLKFFNIKTDKPVILIIGGGTGSKEINNLVRESLDSLLKHCEIIHILGKRAKKIDTRDGYYGCHFLDTEDMAKAFSVCDIAVSRCGLGTLTELSYLGKPSILIPMPDSHQEDNAQIFSDKKAAIVLNEKELDSAKFTHHILKLIGEEKLKENLSKKIETVIQKDASTKIINIIKKNF